MHRFVYLTFFLPLFSCGNSSIKAEYDTLRAKHIVLENEQSEAFELRVEKDSVGTDRLSIKKLVED